MKLFKKAALATAALIGLSTAANAHTVQIGWVYEANNVTTFYAENYHGLALRGGLILNGTTYNFTSTQLTSANPTYDDSATWTNGSAAFTQVVSIAGLSAGTYSMTTTTTSAIEYPWSNTPLTVSLTPTDVAAVPLPAGAVLMLTALGGFGIAARRRRKAA